MTTESYVWVQVTWHDRTEYVRAPRGWLAADIPGSETGRCCLRQLSAREAEELGLGKESV